ncbi:hypothetical protein ACUIAK_05075 [Bacillus cytotoxicus]
MKKLKYLKRGDVQVTFQYDINKNILPFLLMFGRNVKIVEPLWLKKKYREEIEYIYKS